MNLSYFISKRISSAQQESFSSTIHTIAIVIIGIGLAGALASFLVMKGFQETIRNKIFAFSGHLVINKLTMSNSLESDPFNYHIDVYDHPERYPFVDHVQEYAHKLGLVKISDEVQVVMMKGIGRSFDTAAFSSNMVAGKFIDLPDSAYANQVVISKVIADKLKVKTGDDLVIHFFQNPPRLRRLKVTGIYETNLSEYFDSKFVFADIRMIRRLNDWSDSLAGGMEVFLKDVDDVDKAGLAIGEKIDFDLNIERVSDRYMQVFEWLNLVSRQVNIILSVILIVICVNMISIVLILVMERTQMIGMLKALGGSDKVVRSIFVYQGMRLITRGLVLGNILGLGLCFIQDQFKIVKLNAHDYYMDFVPISWNWEVVAILNLLTFAVVTIVLLIPTMVISRISPIKAIRFD
ncbi:MAG TPA: FtsX-like permease family protein [Ohtaekwangia sp.]|nr:FtsX-like permease family protein [Ohtaekwangia sp.]